MNTPEPAKVFVQPDSYLTLHYRLTLLDGPAAGRVVIDTYNSRPATLQMGAGQWAPGLEAVLVGRPEGSEFSVNVPASDAYGERNPDLVQRVKSELLEGFERPESYSPGDAIEFSGPNGVQYSGVFLEAGDGWVLLDFNHPMAGRALRVDATLLGVL
ncbi:MAG TPA: FKBP-type peptidyl-prolyl cis-trans isomerase [Burkholderiaceae bacterium]|nr:FKBP-type peptidyl-prolyl cis-trans isomerase [Burkholderiaceae bacterium]